MVYAPMWKTFIDMTIEYADVTRQANRLRIDHPMRLQMLSRRGAIPPELGNVLSRKDVYLDAPNPSHRRPYSLDVEHVTIDGPHVIYVVRITLNEVASGFSPIAPTLLRSARSLLSMLSSPDGPDAVMTVTAGDEDPNVLLVTLDASIDGSAVTTGFGVNEREMAYGMLLIPQFLRTHDPDDEQRPEIMHLLVAFGATIHRGMWEALPLHYGDVDDSGRFAMLSTVMRDVSTRETISIVSTVRVDPTRFSDVSLDPVIGTTERSYEVLNRIPFPATLDVVRLADPCSYMVTLTVEVGDGPIPVVGRTGEQVDDRSEYAAILIRYLSYIVEATLQDLVIELEEYMTPVIGIDTEYR